MPTATQPQAIPFLFGPTGKQLFGLFLAPDTVQEREFGVVLCNPWGQEYVRAHRSMMQLGLRLSLAGFPVLRFDYFATGDSAGTDEEGSLQQWQADIRLAIQELKRRSRVDSVFLVGLRLGAMLAALVASGRDDVEGLVLWDPAVQGPEYLQDLHKWHEEKEMYYFNQPQQGERVELLGFGLHPTLQEDLRQINLLELKRKPAQQLLVIETTDTTDKTQASIAQMRRHMQSLGAEVDYELIESFKLWTEDPDKGLVPMPVLEAAVNWLVEKAAV